jgi:hypothetical protein
MFDTPARERLDTTAMAPFRSDRQQVPRMEMGMDVTQAASGTHAAIAPIPIFTTSGVFPCLHYLDRPPWSYRLRT